MLEFDYLENFDDKSIEDLEYDKIYWENKFGWEHYLEYEVWYDMGPLFCIFVKIYTFYSIYDL